MASVRDDLTLVVGERALAGWTDIRVTRSVERCPADFDIGMTERYPTDFDAFVVQPGEPCKAYIGDDLVITGYVDRFKPKISDSAHTLRITGRGKCQDLVDCAAEWPNSQISGSNALAIAQKLAAPYGITVKALTDVGAAIPQFNIILSETAFEIIERIARYRALLAYDDVDGNLLLSAVSTERAGSGFTQGENIEVAEMTYAMDQRFSEYLAFLQSLDVLSDVGDGGNLLGKASDPNVSRHRRKVIIAEAGGGGSEVAKKRVLWEASRRAGRGQQLTLTTDSWRDVNGKLWTPNTLAPVSVPVLKLADALWTIGEVTYRRGEDGTHADLTLMPPAAFDPQPVLLQPVFVDVPPAPDRKP